MPKGHKAPDITGQKFNKLTVEGRAPNGVDGNAFWYCLCECGSKVIVKGAYLRNNHTKSCGCLYYHRLGSANGKSKTLEYKLWMRARKTALLKNVAFNLELPDIPAIPEFCPVLGIKLEPFKNKGYRKDTSPSLDRIIPELGYIKGNIKIISWKANKIKNDATPLELRLVAAYSEMSTKQVLAAGA